MEENKLKELMKERYDKAKEMLESPDYDDEDVESYFIINFVSDDELEYGWEIPEIYDLYDRMDELDSAWIDITPSARRELIDEIMGRIKAYISKES